jgi:hypothetical protein
VAANSQTVIAPWAIAASAGQYNQGGFVLSTGIYTVPATGIYEFKVMIFLPGTVSVNVLSDLQISLRVGAGPTPSNTADSNIATTFPDNVSVLSGLVTLNVGNVALTIAANPQLTAGQIVYLAARVALAVALSVNVAGVADQTNISINRIS